MLFFQQFYDEDNIYCSNLGNIMEKQGGVSLNDFHMLTLLGVGNYAKVVLVRKKSNSKIYAMKIIKKTGKSSNIEKDHAYLQRQILLHCNHPFIIKLHSSFQFSQKLYYILQYCPGGELFGIIKRNKRLNQQMCKFYASQILIALEYLHSKKVIYRDLKPENVLIGEDGYIKLIDFGLSAYSSPSGKEYHRSFIAGTPEYISPESFQGNISEKCDWWSFGSIIFEMIMGFPPFFLKNQTISQLSKRIINEEAPLSLITSPTLKDLLSKTLQKNPKERLGTPKDIKKHPWFKQVPWELIVKKQINPPFKPKLSSDCDVSCFQFEEERSLTPPGEQNPISDVYQSFSLSWNSSGKALSPPSPSAEPSNITIHIQQSKSKQ